MKERLRALGTFILVCSIPVLAMHPVSKDYPLAIIGAVITGMIILNLDRV